MTTSLPEHGAHAPPPANAVVERSREAFRDPVARLPNWFRPGARNIGITSRQSSPTLAPLVRGPYESRVFVEPVARGESAKPPCEQSLSGLLAASPRSRSAGGRARCHACSRRVREAARPGWVGRGGAPFRTCSGG